MNECRMVEFCPCKIIGIIISAVLGIAAGALFYNSLITVPAFVLWFLLIFSAVALIAFVAVVLSFPSGLDEDIIRCFCRNLGLFLAGSIGTIIIAVLYLALSAGTTLVLSLLIGLLVFFFGLLITGIVCFLMCVCEKQCPSCSDIGNSGNGNCCCCCYPCNCDCNINSDNSCTNSNSCKLKC